jgi:hypothetical protein
MIQPPIIRHCCGWADDAGQHACPTGAQLPSNDWRRKRCLHCAALQRKAWKQASFREHWPEYREQRKQRLRWLRQDLEDSHPRRAQLFRLAEQAGLLGRAA